jgi:hypothetical protein
MLSRDERIVELVRDYLGPALDGMSLPIEFYVDVIREQLKEDDELNDVVIRGALERALNSQPFDKSDGHA